MPVVLKETELIDDESHVEFHSSEKLRQIKTMSSKVTLLKAEIPKMRKAISFDVNKRNINKKKFIKEIH